VEGTNHLSYFIHTSCRSECAPCGILFPGEFFILCHIQRWYCHLLGTQPRAGYSSGKEQIPSDVNPCARPDATSVGWVFPMPSSMRPADTDLAELRSIQDYNVKLHSKVYKAWSQVASIGGFVKQYRSNRPNSSLLNMPLPKVLKLLKRSNQDVEGRVLRILRHRVYGESQGIHKNLGRYRKHLSRIEQVGNTSLCQGHRPRSLGP